MGSRTAPAFEGLLVEAGRLLASSLDLEETLRTITRLAVPELADWAAVEVVMPGERVRQLSSGHADPAKDRLLLDLRARYRAEHEHPGVGPLAVFASGEPAIFAPVGPEDLPPMSGAELRLLEELAPASWLVVPLHARGELVGLLTFLSTDPDRIYQQADLPVALELADRCAQAVRNAQLYDEAESSRALLTTILATAPVGLALLDETLSFVLINERMAEINGRPVDAHLGRPISEVAADAPPEAAQLAREVLASGRPALDVELIADGRAFVGSYAPVSVEGRVLGVICAVVETTERHHAREAADRLLDRTARLQSVSEQLAGALTADEVADVIVRAGMAATGATCGVLGMRDGQGLRIEHRYGLPAAPPGLLPLDAGAPMPAAARGQAPVLLRSREEWLERFPAVPPRGDFEGFAAVPLLFEAGVSGVMGLGFSQRREFDDGDVEMLLAIARQGAQALDRARLYEERVYVAHTLQAGLLPRELPAIPGLDVAVRYRPLGDGSEVGGDFYDLFDLDDRSWFVAVGDICGKGTAAAVLTGVVRSTIRALSLRDPDPGAVLHGVNEALLRERSPQALATAAVGRVEAEGDGFCVSIAVGGHPPPLVLRAGGEVETVDVVGTLLGALPGATPDCTAVRLERGDLLFLYTDGLIDAHRNGTEPFGEERLRAALADAAGLDAADAVDVVDRAVRAYAPGPPRDDKALLAIRVA